VRALWAATLDGRERLLYRSTDSLTLQDVAPDGRALVSAGTPRVRVLYGSLHDPVDHDLTWFDHGTQPSVTADGKLVAYTESGEGAGSTYGIFVRATNGEPAVRIADGRASAISPDGTRVLVQDLADPHVAALVPTGTGAPKRLSLKTLDQIAIGSWFPDGRHIVILGTEPGHSVRSWRLDTRSGELAAITPEGAAGRIVSPNGQYLAVTEGDDRYLLDLRSGAKLRSDGVEKPDLAIGFTADSKAVYVFSPDSQGGRIFRIASGIRTLVRALRPADPAGLRAVFQPSMSLDGEHFAYSVSTLTSQLFLLKLP
jgi:eukaryotic-like serine/threonine-protein kinase